MEWLCVPYGATVATLIGSILTGGMYGFGRMGIGFALGMLGACAWLCMCNVHGWR